MTFPTIRKETRKGKLTVFGLMSQKRRDEVKRILSVVSVVIPCGFVEAWSERQQAHFASAAVVEAPLTFCWGEWITVLRQCYMRCLIMVGLETCVGKLSLIEWNKPFSSLVRIWSNITKGKPRCSVNQKPIGISNIYKSCFLFPVAISLSFT